MADRAARFSPPPSPRAGDAGPPPRRRGVCQWFDPERKHGFIKPDGGAADIFVHQKDLRAGTEIKQGDAVEFGTADYNGRDKAVDVTKVERQFSHDGPQARGRGGFGDARSAAAAGDGGGHRGPAPPHAPPPRCFGPTALREVVRSRLGERALRALAELETFEADAVVQSLEQAGAIVRDPTAYVCKAVDTVRRRRRESGIAPPRARLDSLQRLPPPPSGDWICGACGGNNLFWRRECFRCGTPPTMESLRHEVEANFPGLPRRRRSRSRERRGRRGRRS